MKKLISVFMSLVIMSSMFASFAVTTHAAGATVTLTEYVESFQLGISSDKAKAKENATKDGYKLVSDYDLNKGTVGDYIYLAYKTTTDPNNAIRDVIKLDTSEDYKHKANGATYTAVGGYNDDGKVAAININSGASVKYIYLFYTKELTAGSPIADPIISNDEDNSYGRNCYLRDLNSKIANLNYYTTIFTPDIYLFYYQNNYYWDLRVGTSEDDSYAKKNAIYNDYVLVDDVDINEGADLFSVYLSYSATGDSENCITDIIIVRSDEYEAHIWNDKFFNNRNHCIYYRVGGFNAVNTGNPNWIKGVNINDGDNAPSTYYILYSRDPEAGEPITSLEIRDKIVNGYYVTQHEDGESVQYNANLNQGTSSTDEFYLLFKREAYNSFTPYYSSIFNYVDIPILIVSIAVIAISVAVGLVFTKKQKATA